MLPQFYDICEEFGDDATFVMVSDILGLGDISSYVLLPNQIYILEAHATNEWPVNNLPEGINELNQATTLLERIAAANLFKRTYGSQLHPNVRLIVDGENNEFNSTYASWPFRVWILDEGRVAFKAMSTRDGSNLETTAVRKWLIEFRKRKEYIGALQLHREKEEDEVCVEEDINILCDQLSDDVITQAVEAIGRNLKIESV